MSPLREKTENLTYSFKTNDDRAFRSEIESLVPGQAGATIDEFHNTLFHEAVYLGAPELIENLKDFGNLAVSVENPTKMIDVQNKNEGDTAMHLATKMTNFMCTKKLLEIGADPGLKNKLGETPVDIAVREGKHLVSSQISIQ